MDTFVYYRETNDEKSPITGIAWKPTGDSDLAFTDNGGFLGIISDFLPLKTDKANAVRPTKRNCVQVSRLTLALCPDPNVFSGC